MSQKDRLTQIWGDFAGRSGVNLSGTSIENTPRPTREDEMPELQLSAPLKPQPLPGGVEDPVKAALAAMHQSMAASKAQRGRAPAQNTASFAGTGRRITPPPSSIENALLADVAFTKARTDRAEGDYISYAAERHAAWKRRKRKKFLGIF